MSFQCISLALLLLSPPSVSSPTLSVYYFACTEPEEQAEDVLVPNSVSVISKTECAGLCSLNADCSSFNYKDADQEGETGLCYVNMVNTTLGCGHGPGVTYISMVGSMNIIIKSINLCVCLSQ